MNIKYLFYPIAYVVVIIGVICFAVGVGCLLLFQLITGNNILSSDDDYSGILFRPKS